MVGNYAMETLFVAEWDLGGFPPWLLAIEPVLRLRSSDPAYLQLVRCWIEWLICILGLLCGCSEL